MGMLNQAAANFHNQQQQQNNLASAAQNQTLTPNSNNAVNVKHKLKPSNVKNIGCDDTQFGKIDKTKYNLTPNTYVVHQENVEVIFDKNKFRPGEDPSPIVESEKSEMKMNEGSEIYGKRSKLEFGDYSQANDVSQLNHQTGSFHYEPQMSYHNNLNFQSSSQSHLQPNNFSNRNISSENTVN